MHSWELDREECTSPWLVLITIIWSNVNDLARRISHSDPHRGPEIRSEDGKVMTVVDGTHLSTRDAPRGKAAPAHSSYTLGT